MFLAKEQSHRQTPASSPHDYCYYQSSKRPYLNQTSQSVLHPRSPKSTQCFGIIHQLKSRPAWFPCSVLSNLLPTSAISSLQPVVTHPGSVCVPALTCSPPTSVAVSHIISAQQTRRSTAKRAFDFSPSSLPSLFPLPVFWGTVPPPCNEKRRRMGLLKDS